MKLFFRGAVLPAVVVLLLIFGQTCSPNNGTVEANSLNVKLSPTAIINVSLVFSASTVNTEDSSSLLSNTQATNITVEVTGCASGYSIKPTMISPNDIVRVFYGDPSCLVELLSFDVDSSTYTLTGQNSVAFTTLYTGGVATFQNTAESSNLVTVSVLQQLTAKGVVPADKVVFSFSDRASSSSTNTSTSTNTATNTSTATDTSISISTTPDPFSVSVGGEPAPNFTIAQARFLSTNSDGTGNYSFTLTCGSALTGSSLANYACSGVTLSTQLDYIFISDIYSQGTISVSEANDAFASNTPTPVGSLIVVPGGSDLNGNTLATGGFYTSNTSPLTGAQVSPSGSSYVLLLRQTDGIGNAMSYLYFYIEIPALSQQ